MLESREPLFTRRTLLAALAMLAAFVGVLYLERRPWHCEDGVGLWAWVSTHCTSQNFVDPYSVTHVLHGVIFFWALWPLRTRFSTSQRMLLALAIEIAWEILENSPWVVERYRQETASFDYTGDSILNAVGDAFSAMLGFAFAVRVSWKAAIAFAVVSELLLLWLIRDNLLLNIIMLLWPLDAIKAWQLG